MHISITTSKLGAKIPSFNLPAGITCRPDAPCHKGCYAKNGNYNYENVKKSLRDNLEEYKSNPEQLFNDIIQRLDGDVMYKFFRWFSSGDLVDYEFWLGVVRVAETLPNTRFLLFTKKFNIVNMWLALGHKLPDNLKVIFSGWDETFTIDNPYNLPCSFVYFKKKENKHIPEYAIPCEGSCQSCKACWSLQNGQAVWFKFHR